MTKIYKAYDFLDKCFNIYLIDWTFLATIAWLKILFTLKIDCREIYINFQFMKSHCLNRRRNLSASQQSILLFG